MTSETKPTVLDLWVCPVVDCRQVLEAEPQCIYRDCVGRDESSWHSFTKMRRVRALVLDDAAAEAAARVLYDRSGDEVGSLGWAFEKDSLLDEWRADARAVLGMEESDD